LLDATGEAVGSEITLCLGVTLQGNEYVGKGTGEKFGVEEVVGCLKSAVFTFCDGYLGVCIVRNNCNGV